MPWYKNVFSGSRWSMFWKLSTPLKSCWNKFICSSIYLFIYLFIYSFIYLFFYLFCLFNFFYLLYLFILFYLTLTFFILQWNNCTKKVICRKYNILIYVNKYNMRSPRWNSPYHAEGAYPPKSFTQVHRGGGLNWGS